MNRAKAARPQAEDQPRPSAKTLEETFARFQDELLGMLYYVVGNAEDARDALQDAFIKCWKHRDELVEIDNLRAWVFRVALNAGRDLRGTAWRRRRQPLGDAEWQLVSAGRSPEAEAVQSERLAAARRAIAGLRAEEQEVFLLRQDGQMTYDQIAEAIGIPVGTVKTRMRLALGRLREGLEGK